MIIHPEEIDDLEQHFDEVCAYGAASRAGTESDDNPQSPVFIADRPHLLMPLGFDEFRAIDSTDTSVTPPFPNIVDWAFGYEVLFFVIQRPVHGRGSMGFVTMKVT